MSKGENKTLLQNLAMVVNRIGLLIICLYMVFARKVWLTRRLGWLNRWKGREQRECIDVYVSD